MRTFLRVLTAGVRKTCTKPAVSSCKSAARRTGLLDDLLGPGKQCRLHNDSKRLSSVEIDDQLEPGGSIDRQISRFDTSD
jgi:hypothetical protein